jgi:cytochrome P450
MTSTAFAETTPSANYIPPRPRALPPVVSLLRVILQGDGDLLSLLPADAYKMPVGPLGYSRRQILIVNDPQLYRNILTDPAEIYPKNDLMVGALEPLVGDSIFVSSGEKWRRQRRMIDPAFSHMRLGQAFPSMVAAVSDYEKKLHDMSRTGEAFSLDLAMSHLTADIICRTVFSTSLASQTSREVFDAFTLFERSVAQVELKRLIVDAAWTNIPQRPDVEAACQRIRERLGELLDTHMIDENSITQWDDIAAEMVAAKDTETGAKFDRKELIDQLGVMFLAGHETTASVLTWVFFILASQTETVARMRGEVNEIVGDGEIEFEHIRRLTFVRNVFRETLRLYPPITFIPRVAAEATTIGKYKVKKGAMIMISPWTIHRNENYWSRAHHFDPDRFSVEREHELVSGAYLPFGLGPRVCVGAAFATTEATLILARLIRRFDFTAMAPKTVRPVARLTTRPKNQIMCRVRERTSTT